MKKSIGTPDINDFQKLSSLPQHALVFCTSSLQDLGIRVTQHDCNVSGGRPPRKTRPKIVRTNQYIKQQLPCKCQIYGVCMDGVVGLYEYFVEEREDQIQKYKLGS